ncbi:ATP-dependent DNA helicase RecQ [Halobacillus sp. BBL2006]|uniref:RecQ family ATP-dependent DNA helicase n=1 Tax=Halobacillus sp. BBL2006 TaxID=1543706 RepID=UPI000542BF5F|nr:ATP-dependent DNA helicase RecQ [Halobacillus sp. BBL2006]KHE69926.1 ATP-dependent DNA helicase [Halobacillus sp. BBL2006]
MQTFDQLTQHLYDHFGFTEFREGQKEIIEDLLAGSDVLGILPTGTGKSLCYQLPAVLQSGVTIVVSPLISLMIDQVKQLKARGFRSVTALNSFMDRNERIKTMKQFQQYSLIYLSPEMLQNDWVKQQLLKVKVELLVVDEAHCISQWGHEFRTDYLKIDQVIQDLGEPTVLALSATATPEVQEDIRVKLNLSGMRKHVYPMDKKNISFAVEECLDPDTKIEKIVQFLSKNIAPTMIYFSSRQWAEKVAFQLRERLNQRVAFYHGGMEQTDRMLVQQQFMNNQLDIICCTSAFGMGVDKPDIRIVIHFHLPPQIESFIQEVGRAGRDGEPCVSLVLFTHKDHYLPQMLIQNELPQQEDVKRVLSRLQMYWSKDNMLPEDGELLLEIELSESQWNFIRHQLEQHGVIDGRSILTAPYQKRIHQELLQFLKERWTYKQNKLTEILQWVHHFDCRRKGLYKSFQDEVREPYVPCCDVCGFLISDLQFNDEIEDCKGESWQDRLKLVFGQGEVYETEKSS